MGQHKIKTIDLSVETDEKDQKKAKGKQAAKRGKGREKTSQTTLKKTDITKSPSELSESSESSETKKPVQKKVRGQKYVAARAQVDRTKTYPLKKALELVKRTSFAKFDSTITADVVLKDSKFQAEITFPHSTGKQIRVAIASDKLISQIEKGKIEFDVLLTTKEFMPKLAKLARTLGPKGLMPNPKNSTITEDPRTKKKELEGGKVLVKTEKKAPLIHTCIGKTGQPNQELAANIAALIKAVGPKRITKFVLSSTMGPGIKVDMAEFLTD